MTDHEKINYVEFPSKDIAKTKEFFQTVFDWSFIDFGPEYTAFSGAGLDGGFFKSDLQSVTSNGATLVIFFSDALEETQAKIEAAGGVIIKPIYDFPGGRRFQFADPCDNEFGVWSH